MFTKVKCGESQETLYEQNGNINKEIDDLKGNQKEILELENTITEMKIYSGIQSLI